MFSVSAGWFGVPDEGGSAGVGCAPVGVAGDVDVVGLLAGLEPGPGLMALLGSIELAGLDVAGRIEVAAAWERQQAWVAAQAQVALAAVIADVPDDESAKAAEELEWRADCAAAVLGWSPCTAQHRLTTARRLVEELGPTFALLEAGEISFRHAWVVADAVGELSADERMFVQARVLGKAGRETVAAFGRRVKRAVLAAAPELAAARRAQAIAQERGVRVSARPDGMAALIATMTAPEAYLVYEALDAAARKAQPMPRQVPALNAQPA